MAKPLVDAAIRTWGADNWQCPLPGCRRPKQSKARQYGGKTGISTLCAEHEAELLARLQELN